MIWRIFGNSADMTQSGKHRTFGRNPQNLQISLMNITKIGSRFIPTEGRHFHSTTNIRAEEAYTSYGGRYCKSLANNISAAHNDIKGTTLQYFVNVIDIY